MAKPQTSIIVDDIGAAFFTGVFGSAAVLSIEGIHDFPRGARLMGISEAVRMNAPRIGGTFAAGCGIFSVFDSSLAYVRKEEDPWNSLMAAAATGGFLSLRQGLGVSGRAAVLNGVVWASMTMIDRILFSELNSHAPAQVQVPPKTESSSWFGGWKKKMEPSAGAGW